MKANWQLIFVQYEFIWMTQIMQAYTDMIQQYILMGIDKNGNKSTLPEVVL